MHLTVFDAPNHPKGVVALVHGFGEHAGRYLRAAGDLANAGFATVAVDLHGHGRTPGPRGAVDDYDRLREDVDALVAEAARRYPDLPIFLFGHSMGGGLVLDWIRHRPNHPVRAVIAQAPLIRAVDAPPGVALAALKLVIRVRPSFAITQSISGEKISSLPAEQAAYESDPLIHNRLGVGLGLGMLGAGRDLAADPHVPVPTLILHATDDRLTDFEAAKAFAEAAKCNFVALKAVEHEIHNDSSRGRVARAWTDFLEAQL